MRIKAFRNWGFVPMIGSDMNLRPYQDDDFDQLIRAWRAASVVAHTFLSPEFLEDEATSIREMYLPAAEAWVAEEGGEVVGFFALLGHELGALFVHPKHWGRGIGHALMDKAVELRDHLSLEVFEANRIGRSFYERYGFTEDSSGVNKATGERVLRMTFDRARHQRPA